MKIVVFDFEVFRYDVLLGAIEITADGKKLFQSWDLEEIKQFYLDNEDSIWVGWNNQAYDNFILQAIVQGAPQNKIKAYSDQLIAQHIRGRLRMKLHSFDLMAQSKGYLSLKTTEAYDGHKISESEVDFNLDRPLTRNEILDTESYNRDDLNQTMHNLLETGLWKDFELRLQIIEEFGLSFKALEYTGTQTAEVVLGAEKIEGIENMLVKPVLWPTLRLENEQVKEFYLSEAFRRNEHIKVNICGAEHTLGAGGIHAALRKYHADSALYFDVSGYYNLIMILLDLLPRSIPKEGRERYKYMYHEQLRLKKIDPRKRAVYKTILLSVFGAMMNEWCKFYDPQQGLLVTVSGQLYIIDLLEKLVGKIQVIQSNTDGVIVLPINGTTEDEILAIINEWVERTGFVLKIEHIFDIHQRDVNCYIYNDDQGNSHSVGECFRQYLSAKEAWIIAECCKNYFSKHMLPEDTIKENMHNLKMFQFVCKKQSFDYMMYETEDVEGNKTSTKLQNVNRVFALKPTNYVGMVYKYKNEKKGVKKAKVSNLPDSVFVYNDEILSDKAANELGELIDWQYYADRAYERIATFYQVPDFKELTI